MTKGGVGGGGGGGGGERGLGCVCVCVRARDRRRESHAHKTGQSHVSLNTNAATFPKTQLDSTLLLETSIGIFCWPCLWQKIVFCCIHAKRSVFFFFYTKRLAFSTVIMQISM